MISQHELEVLTSLLNASTLEIISQPPEKCPMVFTPLGELYMPLTGLIDPQIERKRLEKELLKVRQDIEQTQKKLENPSVMANAPAEKVAAWKELAVELQEKELRLKKSLKQ